MAEAAGQASAGQQALYPPPPAFYQLYRQDAEGTAERPLPPEPPAPARNDYQLFGEMHTVSEIRRALLNGTVTRSLVLHNVGRARHSASSGRTLVPSEKRWMCW